jgi:hypothetical protein
MDTSMQNQRVLITAGAAAAEDIVNMALFLASAAGQHISGQALSVCGNVETMG